MIKSPINNVDNEILLRNILTHPFLNGRSYKRNKNLPPLKTSIELIYENRMDKLKRIREILMLGQDSPENRNKIK
jgi:hypothetical protein